MWGCREVSLCWEGAGGGVGVPGHCEPPPVRGGHRARLSVGYLFIIYAVWELSRDVVGRGSKSGA